MSGKKYAVAVILGAVILGSGFLLVSGRPERGALELTRRRGAEPPLASDPVRADAPGTSSAVDGAGGGTVKDLEPLVTRPPGLLGRVTTLEGSPIRGARVLAVESAVLGSVADRAGKLLANERGDLSPGLRSTAEEFRDDIYGRLFDTHWAEARTDAAGEYRLESLPPGEYTALASHEDHLPRSDGWAIVRAGEPARCDIELSPAWRISGRIRDEAGRPVAGGTVLAEPSLARGLGPDERKDRVLSALLEGKLLLESGRTESAPDGSFSLGSLEPSPHDLLVRKDGFAPARLHDVPAGKSDVEVVLRRGLAIRGRVLSPEKKLVAGAEVTLSTDSPDRPRPSMVGEVVEHSSIPTSMGLEDDGSLRKVTTNASGRFELTGLTPGSFALGVSHEGYPAFGKDIRLEDVSLDLGDLLLDRPEAVVGRVLGPEGAPCPGARVWIEARTRGGFPGWGGRASKASILLETRTGADGQASP